MSLNERVLPTEGEEAPVMARLAWLLLIVTALISGCAGGTASMTDTRNEAPQAQERPPEAGGY